MQCKPAHLNQGVVNKNPQGHLAGLQPCRWQGHHAALHCAVAVRPAMAPVHIHPSLHRYTSSNLLLHKLLLHCSTCSQPLNGAVAVQPAMAPVHIHPSLHQYTSSNPLCVSCCFHCSTCSQPPCIVLLLYGPLWLLSTYTPACTDTPHQISSCTSCCFHCSTCSQPINGADAVRPAVAPVYIHPSLHRYTSSNPLYVSCCVHCSTCSQPFDGAVAVRPAMGAIYI